MASPACICLLTCASLIACGAEPSRPDSAAPDTAPDTDVADDGAADTNAPADDTTDDTSEVAPDDTTSPIDSDDTDAVDVPADPCPGAIGATIGPDGGSISADGISLRVPAGALDQPTMLCVGPVAGDAPPGYALYTPVFRFTPSGLTFSIPAEVELSLTSPEARAAVFLSSPDGPAFEWRGGVRDGVRLRAALSHFSDVFAADGTDYVDPVDRSCTRTRLIEGRSMSPSAIALFVRVEDCHGTPFIGLTPGDFVLREDDAPLTIESSVSVLPADGVAAFVTLVLDMSTSTAPFLDTLIDAAASFVSRVDAAHLPRVRFGIELFSGPEHSTRWLAYTGDIPLVLDRLAALASYVSPDAASTNLRGALVDALDHSRAAQSAFRARNAGGAFSQGHIVLFTDGRDTSGWLSEADTLAAVVASTDQIIAVGLESDDFDAATLSLLATDGVFTAADATALELAFGAIANRIAGQVAQSYLIGYCSPKKNAEHAVTVHIRDSSTAPAAAFTFDATGFGPGCNANVFAAACVDRECGGLGCGACDDALDRCEAVGGTCVSVCSMTCSVPGDVIAPDGSTVHCTAECDTDGVPLPRDLCPFVNDPDQLDRDGDGRGDACDDDDDGDGLLDAADACSGGTIGWTSSVTSDHDHDGCNDDAEDIDDDNDGKLDGLDRCPRGTIGVYLDPDGDGCGSSEDADDDGDGVPDTSDKCQIWLSGWTSDPATDYDGDGCRDITYDTDDDDDGIPDTNDKCVRSPLGFMSSLATDWDVDGCWDHSSEDLDDDGDGVPDASDACPRGRKNWTSSATTDPDHDGCRNTLESPSPDHDGDGVVNGVDACSRGASGWVSSAANDSDHDGCRDDEDDDDDGDGTPDLADACPRGVVGLNNDDHDADGCDDDVEDLDDDGDGVADIVDACPRGQRNWTSSASNDADHDGCRDGQEAPGDDLDGDGVLVAVDACPNGEMGWTSTPATDHDGDGCRDASEDDDDDGDGVLDVDDGCPLGVVDWTADADNDVDGDGCRDGVESDDDRDNDRIKDALDACPDGVTGWRSEATNDLDGDGCRDLDEDPDDDADGVADDVDPCPAQLMEPGQDADRNGCPDPPVDDDGDGLRTNMDLCPFGTDADCACGAANGYCLVALHDVFAAEVSATTGAPFVLAPNGGTCIHTGSSVLRIGFDGLPIFEVEDTAPWDNSGPGPKVVGVTDDGTCLVAYAGDDVRDGWLARFDAGGLMWRRTPSVPGWAASPMIVNFATFRPHDNGLIGFVRDADQLAIVRLRANGDMAFARTIPEPTDAMFMNAGSPAVSADGGICYVAVAVYGQDSGLPLYENQDLVCLDPASGEVRTTTPIGALACDPIVSGVVAGAEGTLLLLGELSVTTAFPDGAPWRIACSHEPDACRQFGQSIVAADVDGCVLGTWVERDEMLIGSFGVRTCLGGVMLQSALARRGNAPGFTALAPPQVNDLGIDVLVSLDTNPTVVMLARFEVCPDAPYCNDNDACTVDEGGGATCTHLPVTDCLPP